MKLPKGLSNRNILADLEAASMVRSHNATQHYTAQHSVMSHGKSPCSSQTLNFLQHLVRDWDRKLVRCTFVTMQGSLCV
jgi:hypothetical protein